MAVDDEKVNKVTVSAKSMLSVDDLRLQESRESVQWQ